jgi:hypothetical protein
MFSKLGLQRFLFDVGLSGQILFVGSEIKDKEQNEKIKKMSKGTGKYTADDFEDDPYK